jgi:hypothetical protein
MIAASRVFGPYPCSKEKKEMEIALVVEVPFWDITTIELASVHFSRH